MPRKAGFKHSPETLAKMRAAHLGVPKSAEHREHIRQARLLAGKRPEVSDAIKAALAARSPAAKELHNQRVSATMKARGISRGSKNPWFGKETLHGPRTHWHDYNGTKLRSTYEARLAQQFDRRGIRWEYEPERFDLGECTYLPDFLLPELGVYWEAKGWLDPKSQRKIELFRTLHPETPLIVATERVIVQMETTS